MAVYDCECGLIISTSSERPRCLRCLRVLGPRNLAERQKLATAEVTFAAVVMARRRTPLRPVTVGCVRNETPPRSPIARPK